MTANVFPEQIEAFRLAGMDDHVGKPLNRLQLYATVDRWLERDASAVDAPGDRSRETCEDGAGKTFDTEAYDQLLSYIGRAKLDDILSRFEASLPWRFGTGDGGPDALRRWTADAHVVLSVAGMTGFGELAAACRVLQAAEPGSEHHRSSLEAARSAREAAVLALADLQAEPRDGCGIGPGRVLARQADQRLTEDVRSQSLAVPSVVDGRLRSGGCPNVFGGSGSSAATGSGSSASEGCGASTAAGGRMARESARREGGGPAGGSGRSASTAPASPNVISGASAIAGLAPRGGLASPDDATVEGATGRGGSVRAGRGV